VPGFRIGASGLPAKDIAYIRALVRLFAYTEKLKWSFVDSAPYSALVAVAPSAPGSSPSSLLIKLDKVHPPHTIAYPIRADQFRDVLKRVGAAVLAQRAAARAAPVNNPADPLRRYKLRRWPSPLQLKGDPLRIRMATLLSRRYISAAELATVAAAAPDQVRGFIDDLELAGLLAVPATASAPMAQTAAEAPPSAAPARGISGLTNSLLDNIRRRIGLQGYR
jgi:hypothetical protein